MRIARAGIFAALIALTACGGGTKGTSGTSTTITPHLVSLQLTPANPSVVVGNTQQFKAMGTFSDNSTQDLTSTATWSSSSATLAGVNNSGLATATAAGTTTINAASGSVNGSTSLLVTSTAASVQISSPSETTANPFDLLTITGSGFDSTATIKFSVPSGFSVDIQPEVISQTSLIVSVPVLFSGTTFASGAANVAVVQSSGQSNSAQLSIAGVPPAPPSAPGTVTLGFLEGELAIANQLSSEVTSGPLSLDLSTLISALNATIPPIQAVVNGTASSASLGSINGQPVTLGATELAQMDQLSLALLQSLANSSGSGGSSVAGGLIAARQEHSVRERIVSFGHSSGTGCLSAPAVENTIYDLGISGGGTASNVAADLVYLNQGIGTSPGAANLVIEALELAPTAILVVAKSGAVVVGAPIVVAAETIEGLVDLFKIGQYIQNPKPTGDDKAELLLTLISNAGLGLAGDISTLAVGVGNLQRDYQNLPQGIPPNPQATACVSALSLNFGTVTTGMPSAPQPVTLTNSGAASLTVTLPLVVGGPNPADFQEADNCPATLAALASCTITVTFTPSTSLPEAGAIGIDGTSPALPITIGLSGTGQLVASSDSVTPSISLGSVGGCAGGSLSGTVNITAAQGITWTTGNPVDGKVSPASGSGSGVVTVTITAPPQTPGPYSTCQNTSLIPDTTASWVFFSDGTVLPTSVTYTYIQVN